MLITTDVPPGWWEDFPAAQMQQCHPVSLHIAVLWAITCFQLGYRTARWSTLHRKWIWVGKNGRPSKQKYVFKRFMAFPSIFSSEGKLPGESVLDCQLKKLRECARVCVLNLKTAILSPRWKKRCVPFPAAHSSAWLMMHAQEENKCLSKNYFPYLWEEQAVLFFLLIPRVESSAFTL